LPLAALFSKAILPLSSMLIITARHGLVSQKEEEEEEGLYLRIEGRVEACHDPYTPDPEPFNPKCRTKEALCSRALLPLALSPFATLNIAPKKSRLVSQKGASKRRNTCVDEGKGARV